jgi:gluconate 2-dehydrogenase gamma chain
MPEYLPLRLCAEMTMSGNSVDRRTFLKSIAASGTVAGWPAVSSMSFAGTLAPKAYAVFTPSQAALMEALVDQLIPPDDYPGGKDAGVVHFIDQKLAGPYGKFYVARYEAGLKQMNAESRKKFDKEFSSLGSDQQLLLVQGFADQHSEARDFFHLVLGDTFEGYYGDPQHGANRDGASWKMIGFAG